MATIGLYDIELWHRGKAMPNLELMKIYNYHFINNDIPVMMRPGEDEGRFSKIIYFKDNPNTQIPRSLSLAGEKKEIYGYGFFKQFYSLDTLYKNVPPSYYPYDPFTERLSLVTYNKIKRSSYIRLENKDFSDYSDSKTYITFADHDLFYKENALDFIKEHKNHRFIATHRIDIKDNETFIKFIPYSSLIDRRFFIQYKFTEDMFKTYYKDRIIFDFIHPWKNETESQFLLRIITMINYYKINNMTVTIETLPNEDSFLRDILIWGRANNQKSFYEFYEGNKKILNKAEVSITDIRLSLKSKPSKMRSSDIDFQGIL